MGEEIYPTVVLCSGNITSLRDMATWYEPLLVSLTTHNLIVHKLLEISSSYIDLSYSGEVFVEKPFRIRFIFRQTLLVRPIIHRILL